MFSQITPLKLSIYGLLVLVISFFVINNSNADPRYWIGGNLGNDWHDVNNWSASDGGSGPASIPTSSDNVFFDSNGEHDCVINGDINVNRLLIRASYDFKILYESGEITVGTGHWDQRGAAFVSMTNDEIIVNGSILLSGGIITHDDNTLPNANSSSLIMDISGDLTISGGAEISADTLGFDKSRGPGQPIPTRDTANDGGAYGGRGGDNQQNGLTSLTYGSYLYPVMLGSGGADQPGGGRITLTVGGFLGIDATSSITANGGEGTGGAGSGGSILIYTNEFIGFGTVSANGGNSSLNQGGGGGGRIAIHLTDPLETFDDWDGLISTYGGTGGENEHGAAGTVYLEEGSVTSGQGELVIDNGGRVVHEAIVHTSIPADQTWSIYKLTLRNKAILGIPSGTTLDVMGDIDSNTSTNRIRMEGSLNVTSGSLSVDNWTLVPVGPRMITGNVTVSNYGIITHDDNSTLEANSYTLDLSIDGRLTLGDNGKITADSLGYDFKVGAGIPENRSNDGGAYGGIGGDNQNNGNSSEVYGNYLMPTDLGSGGDDTSGGGAIKLNITRNLTLNGNSQISANGQTGTGGAGSGGSIYITARGISGAADSSISANGGNSTGIGGGGGGGRVAIHLTLGVADFNSMSGTISADGGVGNVGDKEDGAAGTVYLEKGSDNSGEGELIIDNNGNEVHEAVVFTAIPSGETWDIYNLELRNKGIFNISEGTTLNLKEDDIVSDDPSNRLRLEGTLDISTVPQLTVGNWTLVPAGEVSLTGDVEVADDGNITHDDNSTPSANSFTLNLSIDGDLSLTGTGKIDVDGLGYDAENGDGTTTKAGDGGGYGGHGGDNGQDGIESSTYGSYLSPTDIGSGGDDSSGGGVIILDISGDLNLQSSSVISANGESSNGGCGSGGSVHITAAKIVGNGEISANGGDSQNLRAGGGGGRVAIYLSDPGEDRDLISENITAYGGNGDDNEGGAAGTVYKEDQNDVSGQGELIIDNTNKTVAEGVFTSIPTDSDSDTDWDIYNLTLKNSAKLEIPSGATLDVKVDEIKSNSTTNIIRWEGKLEITSVMTIKTWTLLSVGANSTTGDIIIDDDGRITHEDNSDDGVSEENINKIDLKITGDLTLIGEGTIDAVGLGYDAENGPGGTARNNDGGSYGGLGGDNGPNGIDSSTYGSYLTPTSIGSGGEDHSGGGNITLTVTGILNMSGGSKINANANDSGITGGSGSGGGIFITAGSLEGSGTISANGGRSTNQGGGGGGRVAIYVTNSDYGFGGLVSAYGGKGGTNESGAAGTIYLEDQSDTSGQGTLIIDNDSNDINPGEVFTPLDSHITIDSLVLQNGGILNLNGNSITIANSNPDALHLSNKGTLISESTDGESKLIWEIDEASGEYVFPFTTTNGTDLKFTFLITNSGTNSGSTGTLSVSTYPTDDSNQPRPSENVHMNGGMGYDFSDYAMDRFWNIDLDNYANNPTATVTFTYDLEDLKLDDGRSIDAGSIIAQRFDEGVGNWQAVSGIGNVGDQTYIITGVNEFSPWTFGDESNPLPIRLLSFEGQAVDKTVELDWVTASEINNDFFTIERSFNNVDFEEIIEIEGAGDSNDLQSYKYIDHSAIDGINYYRLKQTDFDGTFAYSDVIQVQLQTNDLQKLKLYPNPINDNTLYLEIDLDFRAETLVEIFDMQGNTMLVRDLDLANGNMVDIGPEFKNGIYLLRLRHQNTLYTERFIVQGR